MAIDHFYDNQLRRYLIQVTRVFGQFSYQYKNQQNQNVISTIPSTLASMNFNVAALTTNNTDAFVQTAPQFSTYFRDLQLAPEERQTPNFERRVQVAEREIDEETGEYTGNCGNRYTVQSYMPVPYRMMVTVYLWTTNMDQKCQIMEQVLTLFNPSITLQSNTNPLDWTSLTSMELTGITWSNNSYPLANNANIEVSSMDFTIPIWLNAPSKVKRQKLINKIITNVGEVDNIVTDKVGDLWIDDNELLARVCVTYENYGVQILDNKLKLINSDSGLYNSDGSVPNWKSLVDEIGTYVEGKSRIILTYDYENVDVDVSGLFYFTDEDNIVNYTIDSLPSATYTVNAIIDPENTNPNNKLKSAKEGDTYLIISDINNNNGFNGLEAKTNDLIYFDGDNWLLKYRPNDNIVIYNNTSKRYFIWTSNHWEDILDSEKKNLKWKLEL